MTNKEWLSSLSAQEFYDQLKRIENEKALWDINSRLYMIEWLDRKHTKEDEKSNGIKML